jgi:hypothetical protein
MIDAPGRAMRPIDPDTVANFAAEQCVAGDLQRLGLGVEQCVLDGTQPLADDTAGGWPSEAIEFGINPLVVEDRLSDDPPCEPLDDGADPRRTKAFVELAPADDARIGRQLDEMVISPAGIAAQNFQPLDLHRRSPVVDVPRRA